VQCVMCVVVRCVLCALSGSLCVEYFLTFDEFSIGVCICCVRATCVMGPLLLVEYIALCNFLCVACNV